MPALPAPPWKGSRMAALGAFMLGHFSHHLVTAAIIPLLPMIRDSFQLDYLLSGLLLSGFSLSYGFAQLPTAALADRVGKRLVVVVGLLGTGAGCVGAGLATGYEQLLLSFVAIGVAASTYHAPAATFISQIFDKEARGRSLGIHSVGGNCGLLAAPVASILVAGLTGSWRNSFLLIGLPTLLAAAVIWFAASAQDRAVLKVTTEDPTATLDLRRVAEALGLVILLAVLTQLMASGMNSFLPLYLVDVHGVPRELAGLVIGVVSAGSLVGAPMGGTLSDRIGRKPVILMTVMGMGPLMLMITLLPFGFLLAVVLIAYGILIGFRMPTIESVIADEVPAHRRSTIMGVYFFLSPGDPGDFYPTRRVADGSGGCPQRPYRYRRLWPLLFPGRSSPAKAHLAPHASQVRGLLLAEEPRGSLRFFPGVATGVDEEGPMEPISTGVPGLDRVLKGGLRPRGLHVVGGMPGTGKTTLAQQISYHHAQAGGRSPLPGSSLGDCRAAGRPCQWFLLL